MKVVGSGNPAALTLRLREREVDGLRDEMRHREAGAEDALSNGLDLGRVDRKTPIEVREAAVAMQRHLDAASVNEQGRVVVTGPTWLLGPSIVCATIEAAERLAAAIQRFVDADDGDAEELRGAVSCAAAWSETMIGYDHAENFGLDD
jgi:hypothetical protein